MMVNIALEAKRRFQNSGINFFLSILEEVSQPRANRIVLMCVDTTSIIITRLFVLLRF